MPSLAAVRLRIVAVRCTGVLVSQQVEGGGARCAIAGPEPRGVSGQGSRPHGCKMVNHPPSTVLVYTQICTLLKNGPAQSWSVSQRLGVGVGGDGGL